MIYIGTVVCNICSDYIYTGKSRHRRSKLQSGNGYKDKCCHTYGVGNGFSHKYTKRFIRDWKEKLAVFDPVRLSNGRFMAMLLQSFTIG